MTNQPSPRPGASKLTKRQGWILLKTAQGDVTFTSYPGGTGSVYWLNWAHVNRQNVSVTVRALQAKGLVAYVPEGIKLRGVKDYRVTVIQP
jgi:hypothetical protein